MGNVATLCSVPCAGTDDDTGETLAWCETILQFLLTCRFLVRAKSYKNSRKQNLQKLAVFCRVRNVVSKDDATFTHIGDFEDDDKNLLIADHYVMIVFDSEFQTTFYCDSLGWEASELYVVFTIYKALIRRHGKILLAFTH